MFNVQRHLQHHLEELGTMQYPASTGRALIALQYCGFHITHAIAGKLAETIGWPAGNAPEYEWTREDLERYAVQCHRHRLWLFWHEEFDSERTLKERLRAKRDREQLSGMIDHLWSKPFGNVALALAEEADPQFRIALGLKLIEIHGYVIQAISEGEQY